MTSFYQEQIKHLTPDQCIALIRHARYTTRRGTENVQGLRNALMIEMLYHHGLRVSELINITWGQIDIPDGTLSFRRSKSKISSVHKLSEYELHWLSRIRRDASVSDNDFVFQSRNKGPLDRRSVLRMIKAVAKRAGLPSWVGCHTLRHSCGYMMGAARIPVLEIAKWLGHKDIRNTMIYVHVDVNELPCQSPITPDLFPLDSIEPFEEDNDDLVFDFEFVPHFSKKMPREDTIHPLINQNAVRNNHYQHPQKLQTRNFYGAIRR